MFVLKKAPISPEKRTKKKRISKNASFSGLESAKSPKQRRKSIATFPVVNQSESSISKPKKAKKLKPVDPLISELDNKYQIKFETTKNAVENLVKFTSENPKLKNRLFNEQFPLFLQITAIKVAQKHSKIARLPLKHPILDSDSEICFIVSDAKGIPNKEHDKHQEHYEQLLQQKGVENIKKIMTFHQFRTEYDTFELKQRLVDLYDYFLVDGRISGKVVKKCGKIFYKNRKVPTPIKMQASKLKEHIDSMVNRTPLYLHGKGDCFSVQFGNSGMKSRDLAENIFGIIGKLEGSFPGGMDNVRELNIFAFRGLHLPIYNSLKNQNSVVIPKEKKKKFETVSGELSTKLNTEVMVKPDGKIITRQISDNNKQIGENAENKIKINKKSTKVEKENNSEKAKKVAKKQKIDETTKKPEKAKKRKSTEVKSSGKKTKTN